MDRGVFRHQGHRRNGYRSGAVQMPAGVPAWSRGRVTLLGDAASCVPLFGDGSSLAMVGATTLAETLAATPEDHTAAFRAYETRHRKVSSPHQRGHVLAAALLVPATQVGIAVRNLTARLLPRVLDPAPGPVGPE